MGSEKYYHRQIGIAEDRIAAAVEEIRQAEEEIRLAEDDKAWSERALELEEKKEVV